MEGGDEHGFEGRAHNAKFKPKGSVSRGIPRPVLMPLNKNYKYDIYRDRHSEVPDKFIMHLESTLDPEVEHPVYTYTLHHRFPWTRMSTLRIEGFNIGKEIFTAMLLKGTHIQNIFLRNCALLFNLLETLPDCSVNFDKEKLNSLTIEMPYLPKYKKKQKLRRGYTEDYLLRIFRYLSKSFETFCTLQVLFLLNEIEPLDEENFVKLFDSSSNSLLFYQFDKDQNGTLYNMVELGMIHEKILNGDGGDKKNEKAIRVGEISQNDEAIYNKAGIGFSENLASQSLNSCKF